MHIYLYLMINLNIVLYGKKKIIILEGETNDFILM